MSDVDAYVESVAADAPELTEEQAAVVVAAFTRVPNAEAAPPLSNDRMRTTSGGHQGTDLSSTHSDDIERAS